MRDSRGAPAGDASSSASSSSSPPSREDQMPVWVPQCPAPEAPPRGDASTAATLGASGSGGFFSAQSANATTLSSTAGRHPRENVASPRLDAVDERTTPGASERWPTGGTNGSARRTKQIGFATQHDPTKELHTEAAVPATGAESSAFNDPGSEVNGIGAAKASSSGSSLQEEPKDVKDDQDSEKPRSFEEDRLKMKIDAVEAEDAKMAAHVRAKKMLLAPLELPVSRSQSSYMQSSPRAPVSTLSAASPLRVGTDVLEAPPKEEAASSSRHKSVNYIVRQTRSTLGRCCFDKSFLTLRINDVLTFQWFDPSHHIYETDSSYEDVVPGGRNSAARAAVSGKKKSASVVQSETEDADDGVMAFSTRFLAPGDYYFVCSKNKRRMRLHVQVVTSSPRSLGFGLGVLGGIVFIVVAIVVVCLVLAYWLQNRDLFLKRSHAATETQYRAVKKLQRIVTLYLFPWIAAGILIIIIVVILAIIFGSIKQRKAAQRQGSHHRGIKHSVMKGFIITTAVCCLVNVVLLFVAYGLQLDVTNGVNNFANQLSSSILSTLNTFSVAIAQVEWLVQEAPVLFPNVSLPYDDIASTANSVGNVLNDTKRWTQFGEDVAQGAFRLLPILLYLTLQLGLFACSLAIGSLILKYRRASAAVAWMLAVCVGMYACATGAVFGESRLLSELYNSAVTFEQGPNDFYASTGLSNDSLAAELFAACDVSNADVEYVSQYLQDIMKEIYDDLDPDEQEEFSDVFGFLNDVVPNTLDALVNYTDYIQANLNILQEIFENSGNSLSETVGTEVIAFLQVLLSVVSTADSLVGCEIFRQLVADALPLLKDQIKNYNTALLVFVLIIFAFSVPIAAFAGVSAYALAHPRKIWYEGRTGRWFRLRYCYKIHRQLVRKPPKQEVADAQWVAVMQDSATPLMNQLLVVKLLCYTASLLMFYDSILLVLYNDIARTIAAAPLIRALSYLGCVQLIFLLLSSLFRQTWVRWMFHAATLTIVTACFVIAVVQAVLGYVRFGKCLQKVHFTESSVLSSTPYFEECTVVYAGHELEIAVYASVILLNCITLGVTLILLIVHERRLKASFMRRHYVGFLSSMERTCPRLAFLFRDYLNVKRMYVGVFIVVVVVFLILIAVVDASSWQLVGGGPKTNSKDGTITQVINPTVACNGNSKYCDLRVNEYIWACTHNAHSSLEDGFVMSNHYYNITHQLYAGIRSFMIDLWYDTINASVSTEQGVYVCHEICITGRRPFRMIAQEYYDFVVKYPNQVLMIIIEQYVNSSDIGKIFDEVGLTPYVWYNDQVPPNWNENYVWPTMQELIDKNQRVMVFNDETATKSLSVDAPEYIYYSYDFQFENSYQTDSASEWCCKIGRGWCTTDLKTREEIVGNTTSTTNSSCVQSGTSSGGSGSSCQMDSSSANAAADEEWAKYLVDITNCTADTGPWRQGSDVYNLATGENPARVRSKLSTMNHFITDGAGSPVQASIANVASSIQTTTFNCSTYWNAVVNILAFDFWTIADPLVTIETMNQNLVKYGKRYNYRDAWSMMLFGKSGYTIATEATTSSPGSSSDSA